MSWWVVKKLNSPLGHLPLALSRAGLLADSQARCAAWMLAGLAGGCSAACWHQRGRDMPAGLVHTCRRMPVTSWSS